MRVRRGRRAWRRKRGGYVSRSASIAAAAPRRRLTRLARFAAWFQAGADRRPRRAAGIGPLSPEWSVGRAGVVAQAWCRLEAFERVLAGRVSECERDLPPSADPQLGAQNVRVRLRRSRRHAEPLRDLDVRATLSDQLDDLSLTGCELDVFAESDHRRASCRRLAADAIRRGGDLSVLHLWVYEGGVVASSVHSVQISLRQGAHTQEQLELVAQVRPHHLGPVGRDCEGDAAVGEGAQGVAEGVLVGERAREQVRGGADLEDGAGVDERAHDLLVLSGEDAVADAVGAEGLDDLADLLDSVGAALLADVDRHAEAGRARVLDERGEVAVGISAAVRPRARDVDAHDPARLVANRLLDDPLVLLVRERPVHHQDQAGADARELERGAVEPAHRGHDDVVEVALAAA